MFPGMDYHVVVYAKYELVGLPLPNLWRSFSLLQRVQYYLRQLYVPHIYPLPLVKTCLNTTTKYVLQNILHNYRTKGSKKMKSSGLLSYFA